MHLNKRIVLTGGSGFIGSHLSDRLNDKLLAIGNPRKSTILELTELVNQIIAPG